MTAPLKSQRLAEFCTDLTDGDIPGDVRRKCVRHILDTVGAGIAGARSREERTLSAALLAEGEPEGAAPLWGRGFGMTPLCAALVNGTASHAFELDDTGGCDHSGAVVVPAAVAALTLAKKPVTGRAFVTAAVLGYELARRPLEACGAYEPHNKAGFHSTGTCGPFGAAAAAARILGLSAEQTQNALGLAGSFSAGLWACVHNGAQSKRLHAGHAAWGGLMSAILAARGFTGPDHIFEEVWGGFNHSFAPASSVPEAYLAGLGRDWKLRRVSIKPYASCRSTHSSIDAVEKLMAEHRFSPQDIREIRIAVNPFVLGMCGKADRHPMNAAQLSIPYSVAADLVFGSASLGSFERDRRDDPRIAAMMQRIRLTADKTQKDDDEPIVSVVLADGRTVSCRVSDPLGSPTNPVTDRALLAKFRSVAGMVLSREATEALAERLLGIEECESVRDALLPLLAAEPAVDAEISA